MCGQASVLSQPAAGSVPVEVTGMQFAWYFRYPGADGKYGRTEPKLMDPSAGNDAAHGFGYHGRRIQG